MRLFLCGRGAGGEAILAHLVAQGQRKLAVFTEPDAEICRLADAHDIPWTTHTVNDMDAWPWAPDLIASIGYLRIIKPDVLRRCRSINCHYALLPRHRGRSPVAWAIAEGDTMTGVTYHWLDEGIDTGPILLQAATQIEPTDTQTTLFGRLHERAISCWEMAVHLARSGFAGIGQMGASTYHRPGPPYGGIIDLGWSDVRIERFIRAMTYPPLPYATLWGREVQTMADFYTTFRSEIT